MAINSDFYTENTSKLSKEYSLSQPYPHIAIDRFLDESSLAKIITSFPEVDDQFWTNYIHYNENKHGLTKWEHIPVPIQNLITELKSPKFISWLEEVTQINSLFADPDLEGSGLHQTKNGGFLNIHADFTVHPKNKNWQRRVNVLVYLNENWKSTYGGSLELWNKEMSTCEKSIEPIANRVVIFSTGKHTYHGYAKPLTCPENVSRKSIALYYYTKESSPQKFSTIYKPRPVDGSKKWLIWGDTFLISIYSKLKGVFGLNDDLVSSILKKFNNKK